MTYMTITTLSILPLAILTFPLIPSHQKLQLNLAMKMAFFSSIIPAMLMIKHTTKSVTIHTTLLTSEPMNIDMSITFNQYTMFFIPTALLVTWSIMEFSPWYIKKTKLTKNFTNLLLLFLISMMILATAGSLLQLLIGWEGVGILSFLLINWWFSRTSANSAALQAIIYNRIGDIGLILVMTMLATNLTSWNTELALTLNTKNALLTLGFMLAATGKSAQFFMHMWLPAAMEGPTPVSALLHSSTMVVAGIYLLAQFHPILDQKLSTSMCLLLGVTTSIYAATSALTQNDIKKIVAFSTSSQLGLMMTAIGTNQPHLAIFHIISHATFKATLFLSAGSMIHNMMNEQDIRKMGATKTALPIASAMITTNGLTLSGLPFLSGFYSKDAIIETLLPSTLNTWAITATLISTTMTSSYTMRMMLLVTTKTPNHKPTMLFHETKENPTPSMIRLTMLTITLGPTIASMSLNSPTTLTTLAKIAPLLTILIGAYLAMEFNSHSTKPYNPHTTSNLINNLAFFKMLHRLLPNTTLDSSYLLSHQLTDLIWLEKAGPNMAYTINTSQATIASSQKGLMKNYLMATLITITTLILLTTMT